MPGRCAAANSPLTIRAVTGHQPRLFAQAQSAATTLPGRPAPSGKTIMPSASKARAAALSALMPVTTPKPSISQTAANTSR